MATYEKKVIISGVDESGNKTLMYPVTKLDYVEGSGNLLRYDKTQTLTDEQKAIVRANIGADEACRVTYLESTDTANLVNIRDLESGTYIFYGKFKPFASSSSTLTFSSSLMVNVVKRTSDSQVMVFYPVNNCVQYLYITDTEYTRKNIYLNDVSDAVDTLETAIGDLTTLNTTEKSNLVAAINEAFNSGGTGVEVPDYVVTEAMTVLDNVVSAQGERTFTIGAISDMHYGSSDYIDGVIHATQGLKHISERIKLDAIAVLGDYTDEHQMDTDTAVTDLEEMNALLDPLRHNVNLRLKGNHDHRPGCNAQIYRYITAYSDDVVWGSRIGGYYYRDFADYKVRVICLNTTEVARDNLSVSVEQYNFFINALDLSSKEDAGEWGILLLSHHPLDFTVTDGNYRFGPIINAYQNGTSWSDSAVSCDYTGKNAAMIIANIHGHLHNLLTDKLYVGVPGSSAQTSVYRLCTPASRVDYVNHYSAPWIEDTWYNKTQNTAEDTSFCVYCIDLDAFTIKAFCYGAGYDREVLYSERVINLVDTVGYTDNTRYSASSHGLKDATGYVTTGEITVSVGDVIRTSGVNFDAAEYQYGNIALITDTEDSTYVTNSSSLATSAYVDVAIDSDNNLTVTIKRVDNNLRIRLTGYGSGEDLIVTRNQLISGGDSSAEYVNWLPISTDASGAVYNGTGWKADTRYSSSSSSESSYTGIYLSGYIPVKQGDIVRLKNVGLNTTGDTARVNIVVFGSDKSSAWEGINVENLQSRYSAVLDSDGVTVKQFTIAEDIAYFRINATYLGNDSVVTINQEIQ